MSAREVLVDALVAAASDARPRFEALARETLADAQRVGGEAARLAAEATQGLAEVLRDAAAGRISPEAARAAADRYVAALGEVRAGVAEAAAVAAADRARRGLEILKDVGLGLARVAAGAALSAL